MARTRAQIVDAMTGLGHDIVLVRPRRCSRQASGFTDDSVEVHTVRGVPLRGYPGPPFGAPSRTLFDGSFGDRDIVTEAPHTGGSNKVVTD